MVLFEWDEKKNRMNRLQHGIGFEEAIDVFGDPYALVEQDRIEDGKRRWQTMGWAGPCGPANRTHRQREKAPTKSFASSRPGEPNRKERTRYEEDRAKSTY